MKTGNLNHELEMIRNEQTDTERYKKSIAYYLLSITLGADDHDVTERIQEKLLEKMHWEEAVQFLQLKSGGGGKTENGLMKQLICLLPGRRWEFCRR